MALISYKPSLSSGCALLSTAAVATSVEMRSTIATRTAKTINLAALVVAIFAILNFRGKRKSFSLTKQNLELEKITMVSVGLRSKHTFIGVDEDSVSVYYLTLLYCDKNVLLDFNMC